MNKPIRFSLLLGTFLSVSYLSFSQNVGINTTGAAPNASAILDLNTGNAGTMGLLPEQVALTATNAAGPIALPSTGLIVYNTATAGVTPNNVTPGYYFNAGTPAAPNWVQFVAGNSATTNTGGWLLNGNTGTVPAVNFMGTTDANAINFRTNNIQRMTILTGGNVGINTAAPAFNLEVDGNATTTVGYFNNTSTTTGYGVEGINSAAANSHSGSVGVFGQSNQYVTALPLSAGVIGFNTNNNTPGSLGGTGVIGIGDNQGGNLLLAGEGGAFSGWIFGVFGWDASAATTGTDAGVFQDGAVGGQVNVNAWNLATHYKIISTFAGTVSCSVKDLKGNSVVMHCPETPEIYYEDYGEGSLVNGIAHINLDAIYAKNVAITANHPLRVFIQLDNDETCKGVVVKNKTATGFDVVELGGGTSNTPFEWHVVCNAKDEVLNGVTNHLQDNRFEAAPAVAKSLTEQK